MGADVGARGLSPPRKFGYVAASRLFLLLALLSLVLADLKVTALDPWAELRRLLAGIVRPDLLTVEVKSIVWTVAFAVLGVGLGASAGLALAVVFARSRTLRLVCAFLRSVHELFWALLLLQVTGLSPTTGILAIALPYAGIFAKVFSEMIEEADLSAVRVLPSGTSALSAFVYARLPELAVPFKTYTLYRLEFGLRSTLVLGFIGLPTMGFHLESAFRQGRYAEAAGLLLAFYVLIGTRRLWARPSTIPILLIGSLLVLPATVVGGSVGANLVRFLAGITPAPLRGADLAAEATWLNVGAWLKAIATKQIVPGAIQTLVLSQITLVATAIGALVLFPLVCRRFVGRLGQPLGPIILVVVRSPPEYMLASVLLKIRGPSMLPAILALTIHNAGIIGYLMGRHADTLDYRPDAPTGV